MNPKSEARRFEGNFVNTQSILLNPAPPPGGWNGRATRTFINKYYDEFAAKCPEAPSVPLTIKRGNFRVATPMGSNTW